MVLSGSVTAGSADAASDVDIYVYLIGELPLSARAAVAADGDGVELDNRFWEHGDEWLDASAGIPVDVTYRSLADTIAALDRVLVRHEAALGYTTSMWHNIATAEVLVDKDGHLRRLQSVARQPYPEGLRQAIVAKNHPVLRGIRSSYAAQLAAAVGRHDTVNVSSRSSALLASVFDIIFAANRMPHPGEKRLLALAEQRCRVLPREFAERVRRLVAAGAAPEPAVLTAAAELLDALDEMLVLEGLVAAPVHGQWAPR